MTEQETRYLLEGILLGMLGVWYMQAYLESKRRKKEREKLIKNIEKLDEE